MFKWRGSSKVLGNPTFADSFHSANLATVFHSMDAEVDFRKRFLLLDSANGIVDLDVALLRHGGHRGRERRLALSGVHDEFLKRRARSMGNATKLVRPLF